MSSVPLRDTGRTFHRECTGAALDTVHKHADPQGASITLFASSFCPFVQRAWLALEYLEVPYYVNEVNPYNKTPELLAVSPKGLVPALRLSTFPSPRVLNESTVIVDYINDLAALSDNKKSLMPPQEYTWSRALIRLQADVTSRNVVPAFYRYLQSQDPERQEEGRQDFLKGIERVIELFERAENEREEEAPKFGLWQAGGVLSLADVLVGPWLFRATNVLKYYRGFSFSPLTEASPRFEGYLERLLEHPTFKSTCSTEQLYIDSYERYAFNRPNTSLVADAINNGRGIP
ncbi:hypothetical protein DL93DRAFT_2133606 [Clavulina sp. PMI_390]|nr:hypothetical protein DL93DRAFT_2133606 [Clavulina sp. PMI_390]